jgi:hypothetical protein
MDGQTPEASARRPELIVYGRPLALANAADGMS